MTGRSSTLSSSRPKTAADFIKTATEQRHVLPAVLQRLEWGQWYAIHVRQQGGFGRDHDGILQAVPPEASYGWPDIFATSPREARPLALELKDQRNPMTDYQVDWMDRLFKAGCDCALLRPDDVFGAGAQIVAARLVSHITCPAPCPGDQACTGWCSIRWPHGRPARSQGTASDLAVRNILRPKPSRSQVSVSRRTPSPVRARTSRRPWRQDAT
jgi:hypothetical protein